jgi:membrane associated rhomboid family serine protease
MGIYDRDYYRDRGPRYGLGSLRVGTVTTWLIILNVAVFLLDNLLAPARGYYGPLYLWGHFSAGTAIHELQLWRFVTFQFLHANLTHIVFNMFALYFFGYLVESYLGARRYLAFYLLCGAAGAGAYLLFWAAGMFQDMPYGPYTPLVGASAGIFGVLVAAARIAPDATVMLIFPPIPMRLKVFAWVLVGIGAVTVLTAGRNAGGEAAHLGGAALGAVLIRVPQALNVFAYQPQWLRRMNDRARERRRWRAMGQQQQSFHIDEWPK